jgi:hypothetical protein
MSRPANKQTSHPQSLGIRFCSPVYDDPLKKSPCACRPDTLMPCPLVKQHKDNDHCKKCYLLGKGDGARNIQELIDAVTENRIRENYQRSGCQKIESKRVQCQWPHGKCPNCATVGGEFAGVYCTRHAAVIRYRRNREWREEKILDPMKGE